MKSYENKEFKKIVFDNKDWIKEIPEDYSSKKETMRVICKNNHETIVSTKDLTRKNRAKNCKKCRIESEDEYKKNPNLCLNCNNIILFDTTSKYTRSKSFCSSSCNAIYNNPKRKKEKNKCANSECLNKVNSNKYKYCSVKCQQNHIHKNYISDWQSEKIISETEQISSHIRRYLLEKFDNSCSNCKFNQNNKFTGNSILEVHHIDGNHKNNFEENLTLLCPNCHAMTENFRSRNRGKGRISRRKNS
jgi:hypothetical protein